MANGTKPAHASISIMLYTKARACGQQLHWSLGETIAFQVLRSDTSAKTMQGIQKHERNHANTSQTLRMQHKSYQNSEDESCQRAAPQKLQYPSSTPQDTRCKASLSQESCPGTSLSETLHLQRNVAHMYSAHEIIRLLFNVRVQRPSEQHY